MIYPSIETPPSYDRTEQRHQYYHGLGAGMGQSTSRPKKQQPEEEEGWGLFHHSSDTISAPKGAGPQQLQQGHENLAPSDSVRQNTDDDAPGAGETQHSLLAQVESTALEDEHDIDPSASPVSDSVWGEQSDRSERADEEADCENAETSPQSEIPDPQPDSARKENGNVETSEPRDEIEQEDTDDYGTDHTQEDPIALDTKPSLQANDRGPGVHHPSRRTPYTWFDMIIDLDHPEPLGPAGYFPGPSTMPDLPPLGPRTSVQVL
ncbi:uncharacterized protein Z519_09556 [Cladophialophora bantiana CBS 173.52]|uniref:Uncharacterized protein n=1 Tax=Cladophialophora bantiana (strain ATCC 10958 / CBS 173.52 / CDC B-1940 / NIH 8579) TaxID=1442370 RepID=A0A0D2HH72_CLAB1|nr:uncharacterized protein Z519_09556 [Cladophialophora bantiana CBS 173.52]KIW90125.1 hypothetical protein Z519_09556 [Cladophialophora bantiana CBS 173.52]